MGLWPLKTITFLLDILLIRLGFRPLMGLWPLKQDMEEYYVSKYVRFRPLMGLWPLKGVLEKPHIYWLEIAVCGGVGFLAPIPVRIFS